MPVSYLKETPSQTGGPYVHIGTMPAWAGLNLRTQEKPWVLTSAETEGERIRIEGIVYDGSGAPTRRSTSATPWRPPANCSPSVSTVRAFPPPWCR